MIDYLEAGGTFSYEEAMGELVDNDVVYTHPVMQKLKEDFQAKFPDAYLPHFGGARDLVVEECSDRSHIKITEYDGNESYILSSEGTDWH